MIRIPSLAMKIILLIVLTAGFPLSARAITFADAIKSGGTIHLIGSQTYTGGGHISKNTVINGNGAKIQLSGSEMVSIGNGATVTFNNLIITGGKGVYINDSNNRFTANSITITNSSSNGILAMSASVALYNCRIENIRNPNGLAYGLSIQRCPNLIVNGCIIKNSDMGIYLFGSTGAKIQNSTIQNCNENDGISVHGGSSASIISTTVSGCESGLAITDGSSATVDKCTFSRNIKIGLTHVKGQGIYAMKNSELAVTNTTIEQNDNEGIYCSDSVAFVKDCYIAWNGWNAKDGNGVNFSNTPGKIIDSRISRNYLFGIQATGQDVLLRDCEVRNNRLGGIYVSANTSGRRQEIYGNIFDGNSYSGSKEYELNCGGSLTRITANSNIFSSNPGIGVYFQSGSYGNLTGNLLYNNATYNMNIYKANVSLRKSVVARGKNGIFLNASPSSSIHENDILNCEVGADIMPNTGTTQDFTRNWWGSASGPRIAQRNSSLSGTTAGWNITSFKPWETSPISYYAIFRYFEFTRGVPEILHSSLTMPFAKFLINSTSNDDFQFLAAQASKTNLFPHIPINITLPSQTVYMWVNANRGIRIKSSWAHIELNSAGGILTNLANTKVLKYNQSAGRWDTLPSTYIPSTSILKASANDIQGYYLIFAN